MARETAAAAVETQESGGVLTLTLTGDWTVGRIGPVDGTLRALDPGRAREAVLDAGGIDRFDTAGAMIVCRTIARLGEAGARPRLVDAPRGLPEMVERVRKAVENPCDLSVARPPIWLDLLARAGRGVEDAWLEARNLVGFLGLVLVRLAGAVTHPQRLRLTSMIHHMEQVGYNAIPLIALINFLIGAVVAFMGADILANFGAELFTVDLLSFSILREFAVLLSAVMVAGRSGSAFTAQIGWMKMSEEIDAMRTMGFDPVQMLVLPRIFALVITLPLLTFIAMLAGLSGGLLVSWAMLDMTPIMFLSRLVEVTQISSFWVGLIKAPFFAFVIGLIGCFQGLQVKGTAESLGSRTTISVVEAIFTVIVLDALFAVFFVIVGY